MSYKIELEKMKTKTIANTEAIDTAIKRYVYISLALFVMTIINEIFVDSNNLALSLSLFGAFSMLFACVLDGIKSVKMMSVMRVNFIEKTGDGELVLAKTEAE
ncbi:MAG: hypothetical protein FWG85_08170 [Bacteroidetes bacterium]|nr:hypothetical protein [Bacteroidota bacterium]